MEHIHQATSIIGAGAMGSAAAYHLARRGEPVVLIEQFALGHDRGSSHGAARITRHSYADPAMPGSCPRLSGLEGARGRRRPDRCISAPAASRSRRRASITSARVAASLAELGRAASAVVRASAGTGVSGLRSPTITTSSSSPTPACSRAARAVALRSSWPATSAASRRRSSSRRPVRRIDLDGDRPVVVTDTARIEADRLIVSAGAWVEATLARFSPSRCGRPASRSSTSRPTDPAVRPRPVPGFHLQGSGELDAFYGMPAFLGMGVKVARHGGPDFDPDIDDRTIGDDDHRDRPPSFSAAISPPWPRRRSTRPRSASTPSPPTSNFSSTSCPGGPTWIVASPCSGHGFKFSCLIGRVLADLATAGETEVAIENWKL